MIRCVCYLLITGNLQIEDLYDRKFYKMQLSLDYQKFTTFNTHYSTRKFLKDVCWVYHYQVSESLCIYIIVDYF